jgi:hypothetical protein
MTKPFNIVVPREYTNGNGELKTEWIRAGVAFHNKQGGFTCEVPDGLALTGKFVILPRKEQAGEDGADE